MLSILSIIAPVFALIACGFVTRRSGALGPHAVSELNRFVMYLALPALLFDVMAHASWSELAQPHFIAAYGLSCGLIFYGIVAGSLLARQTLSSASINGLLGSYANTAYIGFPVLMIVFGQGKSRAGHDRFDHHRLRAQRVGNRSHRIRSTERAAGRCGWSGKVALSLAKNPILIAPVLGVLYGATGLGFPEAANNVPEDAGRRNRPLALVVIGLVLAEPRGSAPAALKLSGALTVDQAHRASRTDLRADRAVRRAHPARRDGHSAGGATNGVRPAHRRGILPTARPVVPCRILISTLAALFTLPSS